MNTDRMARLLHDLLKEVRALQARAREEPLPGALTVDHAARLLGWSVRKLERQIRGGQIRTVIVGEHEHVPMSEILRLTAPRKTRSARGKSMGPSRRKTAAQRPPSPSGTSGRGGKPRRPRGA